MLRLPLQALIFGLLAGLPIHASGMPDGFLIRQRVSIERLRKHHHIPGMAVALVDRESTVWCQGFGQRSLHDRRPVGPGTLFSVQSVSKPITAVAVMLAAQEGLVELDAPITRYLPYFSVNSCFEQRPESRITLRLLLAHAAGLTHEPPIGNNYDCPFPSVAAHNRSIRDTWLVSPVGTRYSYSNNGYDLAAEAVAMVSVMPFSEYVRRRLFLPLGMESTTLDPAVFIECGDRAVGHAFGMDRLPEAMPFPGAGSLYASAEDMARLVRFYLNFGNAGGRHLLKKEHLLDMYRPFITPGYGLGAAIIEHDGKLVLNHNGAGFGWQASMTWDPRLGVGCVILANKQTAADLYGLTLDVIDDWVASSGITPDTTLLPFDPFAVGRTLNSADPKPPPCPGDSVFAEGWKKYEGVYRMGFGPGFMFAWYAKLARWFGYRVAKVEVRRRRTELRLRISYGGGYGDWQRLIEHRPGLFFTEYGEAVDFRRNPPTYRNITLER